MRFMVDIMKYKISIYSEFEDGSRERIYYELGDDKDKLLAVAKAYGQDDDFNKKIIEIFASSTIIISLEELNEDGTWTLSLEYYDFL